MAARPRFGIAEVVGGALLLALGTLILVLPQWVSWQGLMAGAVFGAGVPILVIELVDAWDRPTVETDEAAVDNELEQLSEASLSAVRNAVLMGILSNDSLDGDPSEIAEMAGAAAKLGITTSFGAYEARARNRATMRKRNPSLVASTYSEYQRESVSQMLALKAEVSLRYGTVVGAAFSAGMKIGVLSTCTIPRIASSGVESIESDLEMIGVDRRVVANLHLLGELVQDPEFTTRTQMFADLLSVYLENLGRPANANSASTECLTTPFKNDASWVTRRLFETVLATQKGTPMWSIGSDGRIVRKFQSNAPGSSPTSVRQ
jgi:hypothetical protein